MRIFQLPPEIANQIAAGEVIERPASVVKELLENAMDAKAHAIHIDIEQGGLKCIKISDDGVGIIADDLPLAVTAHATSKITKLNDLYFLNSMGFRGEALASIASVSTLCISSKPAQQTDARSLTIVNGKTTLSPCARTNGTTVEVKSLFQNAPVRKKFLKSEQTEWLAIEAVVKRFAMCKPSIALSLSHNGKRLLTLPAAVCNQSKNVRISKLMGKAFLEHAIHFKIERAKMHLDGWVSHPDFHRSQNDKQWVYVNQRMVKDKLLNHALKQAYGDRLPAGRFPLCLLFLNLPSDEVDVNVHPTKHEVRFQQPRLVHDLVASQITQALSTMQTPAQCAFNHAKPVEKPATLAEPQLYYQTNLSRVLDAKLSATGDNIAGKTRPTLQPTEFKTTSFLPLNGQFALAKLGHQRYLVDALHLYTAMVRKKLSDAVFPLLPRPLLVPISYDTHAASPALFMQHADNLKEVGIECSWMGEKTLLIRTMPVLLPKLDIKEFFKNLDANQNRLGRSELLNVLLNCQSLDAQQLERAEQEELLEFLNDSSSAIRLYCRALTTQACLEFFRNGAHD